MRGVVVDADVVRAVEDVEAAFIRHGIGGGPLGGDVEAGDAEIALAGRDLDAERVDADDLRLVAEHGVALDGDDADRRAGDREVGGHGAGRGGVEAGGLDVQRVAGGREVEAARDGLHGSGLGAGVGVGPVGHVHVPVGGRGGVHARSQHKDHHDGERAFHHTSWSPRFPSGGKDDSGVRITDAGRLRTASVMAALLSKPSFADRVWTVVQLDAVRICFPVLSTPSIRYASSSTRCRRLRSRAQRRLNVPGSLDPAALVDEPPEAVGIVLRHVKP